MRQSMRASNTTRYGLIRRGAYNGTPAGLTNEIRISEGRSDRASDGREYVGRGNVNNYFWCECLDCGNEFALPVSNLLEVDSDVIIGDQFWCGVCDGHRYECTWGMFPAGLSTDRIEDVLRIWREWTGHQNMRH